jgi:GNAT superfamily N-acetyltransferase
MPQPVDVRIAAPDDWELVSRLRLAALADAPLAFGSTYQREVGRTEAEWRAWLARPDGGRFVAYAGPNPVGIAAVYLRREERDADGPVPELVSMWVHPDHRTRGVGRWLVTAVAAWVADRGFSEVRLMVAAQNEGAERFYEHLGFERTGFTQPLPHDESRDEYEMSRPVVDGPR